MISGAIALYDPGDAGARPGLLHHMRDFMSKQMNIVRALPGPQKYISAMGEGFCAELFGCIPGAGIPVQPDGGKIGMENRFEPRAGGSGKGLSLTGTVHDTGDIG